MELAAAPSNDALRPGMARALDGRNGRIKAAARDGGSRALHAVASHGRMPVCVYLLEKHVQRKCQRTFGHSFFLFSQQLWQPLSRPRIGTPSLPSSPTSARWPSTYRRRSLRHLPSRIRGRVPPRPHFVFILGLLSCALSKTFCTLSCETCVCVWCEPSCVLVLCGGLLYL
nr:uncharacterized protein LOC120965336 isoform X1 [Aegilops tauschii subsp. strangulata]